MKTEARAAGEDVIDFGMGNPDAPTPQFIVDALCETVARPDTHGYSQSRGIPKLRKAVCDWYRRRYGVELDHESQAIVTLGSKEGLAHLALATLDRGDTVLVPNPSYPVHPYGFVIAGAQIIHVPMRSEGEFLDSLDAAARSAFPKPKMLVVNFPSNPTTRHVGIDFFERLLEFARSYGIWIVQDLAYADLCFDGYRAPSILQVAGALDYCVEVTTMSKSYNMAGWRIGFTCGNPDLIAALARIKSYLDYGAFTPVQVACIHALNRGDAEVGRVCETYRRRRDVLCSGLNQLGWRVTPPKATMYVWARIPEPWDQLGSLEFSRQLLLRANVAVSPGIGFGEHGEGCVRFALIENEHRIRQAVANIRRMFRAGP
ncbi:MAG: aminotransferase class I/II-fold pyridoxal phosphate-dependent enzyme [Gammaproteobacteria bacterium AqS3]|nr:aminotransferase class I/II-fold pyridoxal phosphate-dependent enzyme [Gammaproteobacteria bacterium AqS3]